MKERPARVTADDRYGVVLLFALATVAATAASSGAGWTRVFRRRTSFARWLSWRC
jgi:hypothetical protein